MVEMRKPPISGLTRWKAGLLLALSLLLAAWSPLPAGPSHSEPAQTVELAFPDLKTLPPFDLRLISNPEAGRRWIRFSNSILNRGPGALELAGKRDSQTGDILVVQNIYYGEDQFVRNSLGSFEFEESHNHVHFEGFSLYEVWAVGPTGEMLELAASSGKVSYCVRDNDPLQSQDFGLSGGGEPAIANVPEKPRYLSCGYSLQGLSPGWIDTYKHNTPGQYVDISGLPEGDYLLVSTVDPDDLLLEEDETNNVASLFFTLRENEVVMGDGQVLFSQEALKPEESNCQYVDSSSGQHRPSPRVRKPVLTTPCGL
jgi:hypothetical protein